MVSQLKVGDNMIVWANHGKSWPAPFTCDYSLIANREFAKARNEMVQRKQTMLAPANCIVVVKEVK